MKNFAYLLFLTTFITSCNVKTKEPTGYLNYRNKVDSIILINANAHDTVVNISLCRLFNKSDWDSIMIIRPYLPEKNLHGIDFKALPEAKDSMFHVIGVEWAQGLLFFKKNKLSSYSVIGGNPSFSRIDAEHPTVIPIIKRSNCQLLLKMTRSPSGYENMFFLPFGLKDVRHAEKN